MAPRKTESDGGPASPVQHAGARRSSHQPFALTREGYGAARSTILRRRCPSLGTLSIGKGSIGWKGRSDKRVLPLGWTQFVPADGARADGAEVTATVGSPPTSSRPPHFRKWLAAHHATEKELLVGFHRKGSGTPSITWPESVDEALCFGWIDGVRKRVDETRYTIRFTPRRKSSNWSVINVNRVKELIAQKLMKPPGLAGLRSARREEDRRSTPTRTGRRSSIEEYAKRLRRNTAAWKFFQAQPPSYRKLANWWITSAKKEETREKRLATPHRRFRSRQAHLAPGLAAARPGGTVQPWPPTSPGPSRGTTASRPAGASTSTRTTRPTRTPRSTASRSCPPSRCGRATSCTRRSRTS